MPKSKKPDSSGPSSTTSTPRSVGTPRSDGTNRGKRTTTTDSGDIAALDKLLADLEFEDPEPPIPLRRPPGTKPEPETPARLRSGSDLSPATLPSAHIIEPSTIDGTHTATLVCLHGFSASGHEYAEEIVPQLKARLALEQFSGLRFVFLNAPKRRITCYGRSKSNAWHDYFTDHGGEGGCPEIEEEIDLAHLEWTRRQVHNAFDAEAARLDGDATRVLVVGQSQGACCALDAVLTYKRLLGGAFCSIGQLYSHTPVPSSKGSMHIATFNGASDACIAPGLALRSYARLLDAGYANVAMHMQPLLDHQGSTSEEVVIGSHHLDANRGSKGLTAASKYDAYGEAHGPNTSSS